MTEQYKTPKVLHIQETDCDGNIRTVRYIREDMMERYLDSINDSYRKLMKEMDMPDSKMKGGQSEFR